MPSARPLRRVLRRVANLHPPGDPYSPIPDDRELLAEPRRSQIWPSAPPESPGIEWREAEQVRLVSEVFARQERLEWPDSAEPADLVYSYRNWMFQPVDAWLLEAMLQWLRPRRMIEVGAGLSSLVAAQVNRDRLGGALELICIDPHPAHYLRAEIPGVSEVVFEAVQDVPLGRFDSLAGNDVLFIDTSHTVKTGGDVHWLYNRVLPTLSPGVVVHLHDIFLPRDYPEEWIRQGWGWNEQYLVQSFLAFNAEFEILAGASYLLEHARDALSRAFPEFDRWEDRGGSSLWIRRVDTAT